MTASTIRLSLDQPLAAGQPVALDGAQAHYLARVMRLSPGARISAFNGRDGEWQVRLTGLSAQGGQGVAEEQSAPQTPLPDLWLLFAPIKKARTDFIVEKATELGVARILPVATARTNSERIRRDRLEAHAREAAEQCGGLAVPGVADLAPLGRVLDGWPAGRRLIFCDEEAGDEVTSGAAPPAPSGGPWAILIGPEGGFDASERARLVHMPLAFRTRLGPRILRADTAVIAALTLWHSRLGDTPGAWGGAWGGVRAHAGGNGPA